MLCLPYWGRDHSNGVPPVYRSPAQHSFRAVLATVWLLNIATICNSEERYYLEEIESRVMVSGRPLHDSSRKSHALRVVDTDERTEIYVSHVHALDKASGARNSFLPTGGMLIASPWVWESPVEPIIPFSIHQLLELSANSRPLLKTTHTVSLKGHYTCVVDIHPVESIGRQRVFTVNATARVDDAPRRGTTVALSGSGVFDVREASMISLSSTVVVIPDESLRVEIFSSFGLNDDSSGEFLHVEHRVWALEIPPPAQITGPSVQLLGVEEVMLRELEMVVGGVRKRSIK